MDILENKMTAPGPSTELQAQCDSLRHLVVSILVLLIIISGTFTIYLLRQWKYTRNDLASFRPQATNAIAQYEKNRAAMDDFVNKITDYGKTHPDFAPIMAKYGLGKPGASTATPPVVAPAKPVAPAKK